MWLLYTILFLSTVGLIIAFKLLKFFYKGYCFAQSRAERADYLDYLVMTTIVAFISFSIFVITLVFIVTILTN